MRGDMNGRRKKKGQAAKASRIQRVPRAIPAGDKHALSIVLKTFLAARRQHHGERYRGEVRRVFAEAIRYFGDSELLRLSSTSVASYIGHQMAMGHTPGNVRYKLNLLHAGTRRYLREKRLAYANPFAGIKIHAPHPPTTSWVPLAGSEITRLTALVMKHDDEIRWLLGMLIETGARVGEVAGLALGDIFLAHDTPYIQIVEHPWRRLKSPTCVRRVPLIGTALWAARRVLDSAQITQKYAFPRYVRADSITHGAAQTLWAWLRNRGIEHNLHALRMTVLDRLRRAGCPSEIYFSILGLGDRTTDSHYGVGVPLATTCGWLREAMLECSDFIGKSTSGYDRARSPYECAVEVMKLLGSLERPDFRQIVLAGVLERCDVIRGLRYARRFGCIEMEHSVPRLHRGVYVDTGVGLPRTASGVKSKRRKRPDAPTYDYRKILLALPRPSGYTSIAYADADAAVTRLETNALYARCTARSRPGMGR